MYKITRQIIKNRLTEPLNLMGEGKYHMNSILEIKVTESYLGLDMEHRGCQNDEPIETCSTRNYIDNIIEYCGCLPLSIATSKLKVH